MTIEITEDCSSKGRQFKKGEVFIGIHFNRSVWVYEKGSESSIGLLESHCYKELGFKDYASIVANL